MSESDKASIVAMLNRGEVDEARTTTLGLRRTNGDRLANTTLTSTWSAITRQYVEQADEEHRIYERALHCLLNRLAGGDFELFIHDIVPDRWRLHCFWRQIRTGRVSKKVLAWMRPNLIARLHRLGPPFPRAIAYSKLPGDVLAAAGKAKEASEARRDAALLEVPSNPAALKAILEVFHSLLKSNDLIDLYVGLLLCTGRRQQDLIQSTWVHQVGESVTWSNMAKDRTINAPVLCRMSLFAEAHRSFRLLLAANQITSIKQLRAQLNKSVAHLFVHTPALAGTRAGAPHKVTPHHLRDLYAGIAIRAIPHQRSDAHFAADILGDGLKASMHCAPRTRTILTIE
jgi:hypothetical protein